MKEYTETSSANDANLFSQVTLSTVLDKYFFAKRIRPSTESVYRRTVSRCLSDWLDLPISAITKDMVVERHKFLGTDTTKGTTGEATANLTMRILRALLNFAADEYEMGADRWHRRRSKNWVLIARLRLEKVGPQVACMNYEAQYVQTRGPSETNIQQRRWI